jgi:hypothetical protein
MSAPADFAEVAQNWLSLYCSGIIKFTEKVARKFSGLLPYCSLLLMLTLELGKQTKTVYNRN